VALSRPRQNALVFGPAAAFLALYVLSYVQFALQLIATPFGLDQGEGYDAWSAWLIAQGSWPYTDNASEPYYSSNYPPLWSAVVAIPMTWTGPSLAPARATAAIAALATAALLGAATYRRSRAEGDRGVAMLAGGLATALFLASPYVFHTTPLARVNSLSLMFAVLALSLFEAPTRWRALLGALTVLAALFTKQTALDAAVAALGFALVVRPRMGALAASIVAIGGIALLGGLISATDGAFWLNVVVANNNPFEFEQLVTYLANFGVLHLVLLALAGAEWWRAVQRRALSPWILYYPIALAATLTVGKWGAGESYFLGAITATSLLAACRIGRLIMGKRSDGAGSIVLFPRSPNRGAGRGERVSTPQRGVWLLQQVERRRSLLATALLLQTLLFAHAPLSNRIGWLPDRGPQAMFLGRPLDGDEVVAFSELAAFARSVPGPILSEEPSLAIAAGKPVVGNATQLRNLHEQGRWDATLLVADVERHRFGLVVLNAQLFPAPVLAAIGAHYALDRTVSAAGSTFLVLVPRGD
jgi:hypothetical protein